MRQLVIGVDAMEWSLVTRWSQAGKLPTLRRLLEGGASGELASPAAQLPDTVWSALCTGRNPAKLEKYFYVQYDAASLRLRYLPDSVLRQQPFWSYLGAAGMRVGVVDVPKIPLGGPVNGFQLTNYGAHATTAERRSAPESLLREVQSRWGRHPVGDCDAVTNTPKALGRLRRRLVEGVRCHGEVFRWLMQSRPWDVFVAAFSAPHCAGHHFWRFADPIHPDHPRHDPLELSGTLEEVYRAIDHEIAEMLAVVGPNTRCLVVAPHGMGPLCHASWNLPEILERLGYGRRVATGPTVARGRRARVNPWRILKMALPGPLQYRIKAMLPQRAQHQLLFRWYSGGARWTGCRAFAVPNNDSVGAIRISVRGRDSGGLIEPGQEYWRTCREIADALRELIDPITGRPVVRQASFTHEEFDGPFLDSLPDITILWEQSFAWRALHSPRVGTLHIPRQDARSGSHTAQGFVVAAGPGIPAGEPLKGGTVYDIAPTVLATAGVSVPSELDGRPLATLPVGVRA
jgi:predicted AlkP superfamily phosphohydrolase/phosphomutase